MSCHVHKAPDMSFKITEEEKEYYSLVEKAFRILAPFYDTVALPVSRLRGRVVDIANAKNGSKVLDVATGTGKQAFAFGERGYDVIGVDLSEDMLKVARRKTTYPNVKFEADDATHLPFKDNSFDVSCISFALHDMPLIIREKVLREMARVTKLQGTILIIDYALPENRTVRFLVYHLVRLYEGKYYRQFVRSDLKSLLRKSRIGIREEHSALFGAAFILKGANLRYA